MTARLIRSDAPGARVAIDLFETVVAPLTQRVGARALRSFDAALPERRARERRAWR